MAGVFRAHPILSWHQRAKSSLLRKAALPSLLAGARQLLSAGEGLLSREMNPVTLGLPGLRVMI